MIFPMSYFQLPPYTYGDTTMEDFFADQHYRRRFLQKYSTKLFPKIKKCKNEMCHNYHDNKHSYCSDECRIIWESRSYKGHTVGPMQCSSCLYGYEHKSGFKAFKYHCVETWNTDNGRKVFLVNPNHFCHFYVRKNS